MTKQNRLQEALARGRLPRREFLARTSALGLGAALSSTLASTPARAAKRGGRFRLGFSDFSGTDTLEPHSLHSNGVELVLYSLCNNLVEEGPGGVLIPELAESWESSPDVKKWVFRIREGVEFHNGKTLDAEDVVYSLNLQLSEDANSGAKALLAAVQEIKADGPRTVVVTLEPGNVELPGILSYVALHIVPAGTTDFSAGIGTGPYMLHSFEPGIEALAKRNPNYWKEGRGHFDEVQVLGIADAVARTSALRTGQIDAMNECDLKTARLLEKDPDVQVLRLAGKKHNLFPMRTDTAPYDDNDVRLALKYAIDREHVLKAILHGYGSVGNDHPIASSMRFHAGELPQRQYDPDKARFHLRKAGLENHEFALHVANVPFQGAVDTAVLYQQHAEKCGINIKVVREAEDGYWSDVWMKKPWVASKWSGRINEDVMFTIAYAATAPWNETFWNALLGAARTELEEGKRREMYVEMQSILRDEGGALVPVFGEFVDAVSTRLGFGELSTNWELDGWRAPERWWFES